MTTAKCFEEIDRLAAILHTAKIRCCYMKSQWESALAQQPWGENRHAGSLNQPWHDIATAQAKAALEYLNDHHS